MMEWFAHRTGYNKWDQGSIGYTVSAIGSFTVTSAVSNNLTTLSALSSPLAYTPALDGTVSTQGAGRYLRVSTLDSISVVGYIVIPLTGIPSVTHNTTLIAIVKT